MRRRTVAAIVAAVLMAGVAAVTYSRTHSAEPQSPSPPTRDQFAEDRAPKPVKVIPFDADRAMGYLVDLCKIGPRVSGSDGLRTMQSRLEKHFAAHGAAVSFQRFQGRQPSRRDPVPMANLVAEWHPERKRRVMICGHYDTRPIADQEPRRADWEKPFLSANDGTSTAAFMMELAHHMKGLETGVGVDFVLFDGEEFINNPGRDVFFLGSKHFAEQYRDLPPAHRYAAAILLDLFAGPNAEYPIEHNSSWLAAGIVTEIWETAREQGVGAFKFAPGPEIQDDHLALNRIARIPAIDIIDFNYRHWHKLSDVPENCSGASMANVAKVLTAWLQRCQ